MSTHSQPLPSTPASISSPSSSPSRPLPAVPAVEHNGVSSEIPSQSETQSQTNAIDLDDAQEVTIVFENDYSQTDDSKSGNVFDWSPSSSKDHRQTPIEESHSARPSCPTITTSAHDFVQQEFGMSQRWTIRRVDEQELFASRSGFHAKFHPRQFFAGPAILYRQPHPMKVSFAELFADLIYVACVSQVVETFRIYGVYWTSVENAVLLFIPVWLTWLTFTLHMNRYASGNYYYRILLFLSCATVVGMNINIENAFASDPAENTGNAFVLSFLCARVLFFLSELLHAWWNPRVASFIVLQSAIQIVPIIPWLCSIFLPVSKEGIQQRRALYWIGFGFDFLFSMVAFSLTGLLARWMEFRVAINIEHLVERMGLFTIITIGEMINSTLWSNERPQFSSHYADSLLGLLVSICVQWVYFVMLPAGKGRLSVHPIRRNVYLGTLWTFLHLPFHCGIVLAGRAMGFFSRIQTPGMQRLLQGVSGSQFDGVFRLVCSSLATIYAFFVIVPFLYRDDNSSDGALKKSEDSTATSDPNNHVLSENSLVPSLPSETPLTGCCSRWRLTKPVRIFIRFLAFMALLILMVLAPDLTSTETIATVVPVVAVATLVEELGRPHPKKYQKHA